MDLVVQWLKLETGKGTGSLLEYISMGLLHTMTKLKYKKTLRAKQKLVISQLPQ